MKRLDKLDVSALRALVIIHDCRSFSEGARRLGVTQSTASYTVKALRESLADPLFVRVGNVVEPTARCSQIVTELRSLLNSLDALAESGPSDPSEADADIVVACNFHERRMLMPAALRAIRKTAPRLRVHLYDAAVEGKRQLAENIADIVIGPVAIIGDIFYRRKLFTDRYVCVMDGDNPLAREELTLKTLKKAEHLAITHNGQWEAIFYPVLRARGVNLRPSVSIPSHDNLEQYLAGSRLIATIPQRVTVDLPENLVVRSFPLEVSIQIDMYWTERTHHSHLHSWVRNVVADVARRLHRRA